MFARQTHRSIVFYGSLLVLLICLLLINTSQAGTTGKLSGRVLDLKEQPLPGVNIRLLNTALGAVSDLDGYYNIINIPPARHQVQFSMVGYKMLSYEALQINSGQTTSLNVHLQESVLAGETVVVTAQRPIVEVNLTSNVSTVTSEDIAIMPVQELQDVVNLQAGVVDGHFRGGRIGEVQYQINGVTVNNSYDNSSSLKLDRSLLQEVQVISGTFDAEYGQAMSGVVNVVLKSGTDRFNWSGETFVSDYLYTSGERRHQTDKFRPLAMQNYQFSLSGPTFLPKTYFIASARRYVDDGFIFGERRFLPTDRADFEKKIFTPSGDNEKVPLYQNREWSGLAKISNRSLKDVVLEYQAIFNQGESRNYDYSFRFNPDGRSTQHSKSLVHGVDWTHTLSAKTFYNLSVRQNLYDYRDYAYEDFYDSRYDAAGPPTGDSNYEMAAVVQGVSLNRFKQKTDAVIFKGALTSQITRAHLLKLGVEFQNAHLEFGSPGYLVSSGGLELTRHSNEPPDYPNLSSYNPHTGVLYGQDQLEWRDFVVRAGARIEFFDARSTLPSDLANPANAISGAPASSARNTKKKITVAPRIGVSYPVTANASVFFAYGHFYQMPGLGQIFGNSDYNILDELQAGGISYGVLGNPDIKPERTVQYEFGYKHAVTDFLGLDFNIFYKDIRDLLGVEFISTYAAAEYARLTNVDFGNVFGFTLALDQRRIGLVSTMIDYTWQRAQGNSSDPRETATRASAGEDARPRQAPLSWDQRHTLNATITLEKQKNFAVSAILRYGTGQPYTPAIKSGFGGGLETNSGVKPSFLRLDIRAEKFFQISRLRLSVFARCLNVLDARYANGFVFSDTGSPDYSLNAVGNQVALADPNRYFAPRRLEVGLSLGCLQ